MTDRENVSKGGIDKRVSRRAYARFALIVAGIGLGIVVAAVLFAGIGVHADIGCGQCHSAYVSAASASSHADVACSRCHAGGGVGSLVTDGLRAMGWVGGSWTATVPPTAVDDSSCRDCHEADLEEVTESRGIAMRHSDVIDYECTECHAGSAHRIEGRWYRAVAMEDCMTCHRTSPKNPATCDKCHVPDAPAERLEGDTAWRATHGPGWESTHGMGDLDSCISCHPPGYCIDCHDIRVPHNPDWLSVHGAQVLVTGRESCEVCHDPGWCTDCHQVEMPHQNGFLRIHGPTADDVGAETCYRCHPKNSCDICHYESSHPNFPVAGRVHEF